MNAQATLPRVVPAARSDRSSRPARPPAPALPPLEALDRTHHQMLAVLAELSQLVARLPSQAGEAQVRQSARRICQFFDQRARQHHADEEVHVFPLLLQRGDKQLIQHVRRLQQDHGWLEEDWLALAPQLHAVALGYNWFEPETLSQGVAVFAALYQDHIALEESLIYPEARAAMAREAASQAQRLAACGSEAGNGIA